MHRARSHRKSWLIRKKELWDPGRWEDGVINKKLSLPMQQLQRGFKKIYSMTRPTRDTSPLKFTPLRILVRSFIGYQWDCGDWHGACDWRSSSIIYLGRMVKPSYETETRQKSFPRKNWCQIWGGLPWQSHYVIMARCKFKHRWMLLPNFILLKFYLTSWHPALYLYPVQNCTGLWKCRYKLLVSPNVIHQLQCTSFV